MKRFLTLGLKVILTLVLVMAAILISLPFLVDPNDYKDTISEQVKAQTGRSLLIPGEIKLSIFPWLGAQLGEVELENAPGFGDKRFARMEEVDVRVQLLPLLRGDIKIGHLTLRGLRLNLQRNKDGLGNWEDLLPQTTENATLTNKSAAPVKSSPSTPSTQAPPASSAAALAALSIEGISILNASLHWNDQRAQQNYQIEKLDVEIGRISLREAIPLETSFNFNSREPAAFAHIEIKTKLQLDLDKQFLTLSPFNSNINYRLPKSANMATVKGTATLSGQLLLDLKKQRYTLKQLAIQNKTASSLLPTGNLDLRIESKKIRLNLSKQSLKTDFLLIKAYGLELQSRLSIQQLLDKPRYLASVDLTEFNPRQLMKTLEMESLLPATADKNTLSRARLGLRIIGASDNLLLKPVILQLDDSNLQGHVSIKNFSRPAVRYKLVLNEIDLDRYLPLPPQTKATAPVASGATPARAHSPTAPATAEANDVIALPLELLRNLNINGQLSIGKLTAANLRLSKITLGTVAKKGQIRLKPLSAKLYQGSYNGDIRLDVRRNTPQLDLNESLQNIAIGPLLKDLVGDDKIRGKASIRAKLNSRLGKGGLEMMAAKRSLNGSLNFTFENGAVKGFNLAQYERELRAKLKKQPAPKNTAPLETDFARISGSAKIINGILDNRDLRAALPHARVKGQGKVNLISERLDYRLDVKFTSAAEGQGGKTWEQMNKVPLPVYIKGPFTQPQIEVDYQSVLKTLAKQELKKQEKKLKQKAKAKLKQKLEKEEQKIKQKAKDALKNLLRF